MEENIKCCAIEYCKVIILPPRLKKKNFSTTTYYHKEYKNEFTTEKTSFNKDAIF